MTWGAGGARAGRLPFARLPADAASDLRPAAMRPLVQAASRNKIGNADSRQALEPLALGVARHEDVKLAFFLDISSAANRRLQNIISSPNACARTALWTRWSGRRGPCCPRGLKNRLVGSGPEDALLKQPLKAPALAGSFFRRCEGTVYSVRLQPARRWGPREERQPRLTQFKVLLPPRCDCGPGNWHKIFG
jgi:hypothetical protein